MHPVEERTLEIGSKLEKEQANLNLLKERIAKSAQIAKGIDGILNTFEERLSRLEDTILPVYNETENLQKSQHNIDRTLQLLDNVISYYEVSSKVDDIIEKGPGVVTEGGIDLETYLQSLNRLSRAQKYFEKHIPQSVELENVTSLFNKGSDKLNFEFKSILDKHSKPLLPVALMNLINNDEDTSNEDVPSSPPQFPEQLRQDLIKMAAWLLDNGRDEYLTVYGVVRGQVLQKSMTLLRNHQRSVSGGSMHGGTSSPMFRTKFQERHEASRKPSTRRLQVFEKKANRMLLKASQTLEHSTGLTLGGRRASSHLDTSNSGEEMNSEQEMVNYLFCVVALHKLMQIEQTLMKGVVATEHQPRVFELIVREAMDTIVQDGENIAARAKRCIGRHDFGAVLVIFPILKQLLSLKPDFERTVEECDPNVRLKFESILKTLHSTGAKALEDFIESLRLDSVSQLPKDGTVHELTSNVLMFLEQLLEYTDTIGQVLAEHPSYSKQLDKLRATDENKAYIGLYIKKVLVQLNHTLLSKSEQYSDPALKAIFRLNNNNYVLKSLHNSMLLELYLISEPKCKEYYYNSIQEHKKAYLQRYFHFSLILNEPTLQYTVAFNPNLSATMAYFWLLTNSSSSYLSCNEGLVFPLYYQFRKYQHLLQFGPTNPNTGLVIVVEITDDVTWRRDFLFIKESWSKLLNYISTEDAVSLQHTDKLKDKERAFLKEKFAGFNKEIEEIVKVQRGYSIPDVELRESLKRDNKEYIIPKYNLFYNIFADKSFTKHKEKYIKYKPDEVATIIDKFFDVAA